MIETDDIVVHGGDSCVSVPYIYMPSILEVARIAFHEAGREVMNKVDKREAPDKNVLRILSSFDVINVSGVVVGIDEGFDFSQVSSGESSDHSICFKGYFSVIIPSGLYLPEFRVLTPDPLQGTYLVSSRCLAPRSSFRKLGPHVFDDHIAFMVQSFGLASDSAFLDFKLFGVRSACSISHSVNGEQS